MANIYFVVGDKTVPVVEDVAIFDHVNLSHTIQYGEDVDAERTTMPTGGADIDLILVSASCSSGQLGTKNKTLSIPVVALEGFYWDALGMSTVDATGSDVITIDITDSASSLAGGLSGLNNQVFTSNTGVDVDLFGVLSANLGAAAQEVAEVNNANLVCIFSYEKNSTLADLTTANDRRVGLGLANNSTLNSSGLGLVTAAIDWGLGSSIEFTSAPAVDQITEKSMRVRATANFTS